MGPAYEMSLNSGYNEILSDWPIWRACLEHKGSVTQSASIAK